MSLYWVHFILSVFVVTNISKVSKYYLFWILLILFAGFSSHLRLSLEYFLISSALIGFSLADNWQNEKNKNYILLLMFVVFLGLDLLGLNWVEKGSIVMLLPVFIASFYPLKKLQEEKSKSKIAIYLTSFLAVLFSNKRTTLFAYLATLKNLFSKKILALISVLVIASSFFVKDNLANFYRKSIAPRFYIWQASMDGFKDKPVLGHGYGNFTLDFPPYRKQNPGVLGAQDTDYVVHAHNQFLHTLFELGIVGMAVFGFLLFLIFKYLNNAFLPFVIMSFFNVSLQEFTQVFFLALIFNSFNIKSFAFKKIESELVHKILKYILILVTTALMLMSSLGHYFFDSKQLAKAIKVDPLHPLYHFSRGAKKINTDIEKSKIDLKRAVELAPGLGYFHGFYAAALLGTADFEKAKYHIRKSLKQMGEDPYLLILSSFIEYEDEETSGKHYQKALELNPDLETYLSDPTYSADEFIGVRSSNPRIMSFYRRGSKVYLPLPFIEDH